MFENMSVEKIEEVRNSKKFGMTNFPWNKGKFNSRRNCGSLSELCKKSKAKNFREFEKYYLNDNSHRKISDIGLDFHNYLQNINFEISKEEAILYSWIRIVYETYLGREKESKSIEYISKKLPEGFTIEEGTERMDFDYSVDAIIRKEGKLFKGIQIKSLKYKKNHKDKNSYVHKINKRKNELFLKDYKIDVIYAFYKNEDVINIEEILKLCV